MTNEQDDRQKFIDLIAEYIASIGVMSYTVPGLADYLIREGATFKEETPCGRN